MSLLKHVAAVATATLAAFASISAAEQARQPSRPVALVVGAAPGGSIDLTARLLQRAWDQQKLVPTPVIVINKPGAGQGIAWAYMIEKGGDGHAVAIGGPSLASTGEQRRGLSYQARPVSSSPARRAVRRVHASRTHTHRQTRQTSRYHSRLKHAFRSKT